MRISDWSSDVCSSDLFVAGKLDEARQRGRQHQTLADQFAAPLRLQVEHKAEALVRHERKGMRRIDRQIGSASRRARVCQYVSIPVVALSLKQKQKSST